MFWTKYHQIHNFRLKNSPFHDHFHKNIFDLGLITLLLVEHLHICQLSVTLTLIFFSENITASRQTSGSAQSVTTTKKKCLADTFIGKTAFVSDVNQSVT